MIRNKKKKGRGRRRVRGATRDHARGCVSLFPFFFDLPNTQGRGGRSGGRRDPEEGRRVGDGKWQRDGGGARVRRKENKDRTQSNQQQLNA